MSPTTTKKTKAPAKKEKIFHPASRKAGQLARKALRKDKLQSLLSKRSYKHDNLGDFYGFFYHALPEEGIMSLEELHQLINDVWVTRFDADLERERSTRRKGRPKSTKETSLEDLQEQAQDLYRTGMEVIDLTHQPNVDLFRKWDQKEVPYLDMLRYIRIFRDEPNRVVVTRPGKHISLQEPKQDDLMDTGS